jgi:hypothetical protein
MALQGLDRAEAPNAAKAKAMLGEIQGAWWMVYIGGPRVNRDAAKSWTPNRVQEYRAQGITRFLLTYVGRQVLPDRKPPIDDRHLLTTVQGGRDGEEACQIAERFGFGAGTPICLDLERSTFDASPRGSLDYAGGWCQAVRARGLRPGVYANRAPVEELARRNDRPDWVLVASFVKHKVDPNADPHRIPKLSDELFSKPGQRAWQYAGEPAKVGGLGVDISVADSDCLAGPALGAGLSMADIKDILDAIDGRFRLMVEGDATHLNNLKSIRDRVVDLQKAVDDLAKDVKKLNDAHPHP